MVDWPKKQVLKAIVSEGDRFGVSMVGEPSERVLVNLPVGGKPTQFDLTEQIKQACSIIVDPIVQGLNRLISSFDPEFQGALRNRVLLAGGGSMIRGLDSAIEAAMQRALLSKDAPEPAIIDTPKALQDHLKATNLPADVFCFSFTAASVVPSNQQKSQTAATRLFKVCAGSEAARAHWLHALRETSALLPAETQSEAKAKIERITKFARLPWAQRRMKGYVTMDCDPVSDQQTRNECTVKRTRSDKIRFSSRLLIGGKTAAAKNVFALVEDDMFVWYDSIEKRGTPPAAGNFIFIKDILLDGLILLAEPGPPAVSGNPQDGSSSDADADVTDEQPRPWWDKQQTRENLAPAGGAKPGSSSVCFHVPVRESQVTEIVKHVFCAASKKQAQQWLRALQVAIRIFYGLGLTSDLSLTQSDAVFAPQTLLCKVGSFPGDKKHRVGRVWAERSVRLTRSRVVIEFQPGTPPGGEDAIVAGFSYADISEVNVWPVSKIPTRSNGKTIPAALKAATNTEKNILGPFF